MPLMGPGTNEPPGEERETGRGRKELMHRVTAPTLIPGHQPEPEQVHALSGGSEELAAPDVLSIERSMV